VIPGLFAADGLENRYRSPPDIADITETFKIERNSYLPSFISVDQVVTEEFSHDADAVPEIAGPDVIIEEPVVLGIIADMAVGGKSPAVAAVTYTSLELVTLAEILQDIFGNIVGAGNAQKVVCQPPAGREIPESSPIGVIITADVNAEGGIGIESSAQSYRREVAFSCQVRKSGQSVKGEKLVDRILFQRPVKIRVHEVLLGNLDSQPFPGRRISLGLGVKPVDQGIFQFIGIGYGICVIEQNNSVIIVDAFNQAVALDSSFALAYAGLGDAYYIMVWWGWLSRTDGYPIAKRFIQKALELDPKLAEAHAALGSMTCFIEYQWEEAENHLIRALELNPNYATGHQYYAELLDITRRNIKARKHMNRALELNPMSVVMNTQSSAIYFRQGNYEKAIELGEKAFELDPGIKRQRWRMFKTYWMMGQDTEAINQLHLMWQSDTATIKYVEASKIVFDSAGINGLFRWVTDIETEIHPTNAYRIAESYAMIGEKQLALMWLEKAYELQLNTLPQINNHLNFEAFRSEPRFQALLEKMNLAGINYQ